MRHIIAWFTVALVALAVLVGCGGGGGGGGGTPSGTVNVFATDDLTNSYDHVWVKLYKVEFRRANDTYVTTHDDPLGRVVDLRALNSGGTNLYAYLGSDSVPQGTYAGLRLTLDREVTLVPTGGTTAEVRNFDASYGPVRAILDVNFTSALTVTGASSSDVWMDFDLSTWTIGANGAIQTATVLQGTGNGFSSPGNHRNDDHKGLVTSLQGTAPNQTFVLETNYGTKVLVETTSGTSVMNNNGAPNPVLANGQRVEVRGAYNPATQRFVATTVKIKLSGDNDEFEVKGEPFDANTAARTFKVRVREAEGFLPTSTEINVVVNDSTRFFGHRGVVITEAQFFAEIPPESTLYVEVEGTTYNAATRTLTAKKCKLDSDSSSGGGVEATGTVTTIDMLGFAFSMNLVSWEGFSSNTGRSITVNTSLSTEFRDLDNQHISRAAFFALVAAGMTVKVEGTLSGDVITATEVKIRAAGGGGGGNDPHEIQGSVSNVVSANRQFTVHVIEWFGFAGSVGMQIQVTMNANATYRDDDGNSITEAEFFAALSSGRLVEVDGTVSGTTMVGTKAKLDDD